MLFLFRKYNELPFQEVEVQFRKIFSDIFLAERPQPFVKFYLS